jgi:hypothetical protein
MGEALERRQGRGVQGIGLRIQAMLTKGFLYQGGCAGHTAGACLVHRSAQGVSVQGGHQVILF